MFPLPCMAPFLFDLLIYLLPLYLSSYHLLLHINVRIGKDLSFHPQVTECFGNLVKLNLGHQQWSNYPDLFLSSFSKVLTQTPACSFTLCIPCHSNLFLRGHFLPCWVHPFSLTLVPKTLEGGCATSCSCPSCSSWPAESSTKNRLLCVGELKGWMSCPCRAADGTWGEGPHCCVSL